MAETKILLSVDTLSKKEIDAQISQKVTHLKAIFDIDSEEVREFAYKTVTDSKKQIKLVETERKKVTSILDAEKKKYMDFEKEIVLEISTETERVANLVIEYDKVKIQKANEEHERYRQQLEAQQTKQQPVLDENDWFSDIEEKQDVFVEAVQVPQIGLPKGTTGTKSFRILDFNLIPDMFKVLDEKKVREAMKNGIEIVGIEYFLEQKTTFR
jgi:hypothetical protein